MGAPNLVPDNLDNGLSVNVINHLKRLKNQAKMEYDRLCSEVAARQPGSDQAAVKVTPRRSAPREATSNPALKGGGRQRDGGGGGRRRRRGRGSWKGMISFAISVKVWSLSRFVSGICSVKRV